MPIYAYECRLCGSTLEVEQRMTDRPLSTCPKCRMPKTLIRLIQPVAIHFRGSGFHVNDYSSGPKAKEAKSTPTDTCTGDPGTCSCSQQD
ncbi:MAG: FmdB family transcriptional regulator [Armatimonadota bacterium]